MTFLLIIFLLQALHLEKLIFEEADSFNVFCCCSGWDNSLFTFNINNLITILLL